MASLRESRLKTRIWVQAQVRLCDIHFIPMVVAKRGDPDAGTVLVRLLREDGMCLLLRRQFDLDGEAEWVAVPDGQAIENEAAQERIAREIKRDPDLWVVEVDDPKARYWPDKPIED